MQRKRRAGQSRVARCDVLLAQVVGRASEEHLRADGQQLDGAFRPWETVQLLLSEVEAAIA